MWAFLAAASLAFMMVVASLLPPDVRTFFLLQTTNAFQAGTWEDDPKNWSRAFHEQPPANLTVVHSKYWKSNHFTDEFVYYFEVQASAAWKDAFLKKHGVELLPPPPSGTYRTNHQSDLTPNWFVPGPPERYEVWGRAGFPHSLWIDKTNGHLFFYDEQV